MKDIQLSIYLFLFCFVYWLTLLSFPTHNKGVPEGTLDTWSMKRKLINFAAALQLGESTINSISII